MATQALKCRKLGKLVIAYLGEAMMSATHNRFEPLVTPCIVCGSQSVSRY